MWLFFSKLSFFFSGPNLKKAIRFHSCATFEYQSDTYIITVGGLSTKTTQILNTKHTEWFYGKLDSQWYKL